MLSMHGINYKAIVSLCCVDLCFMHACVLPTHRKIETLKLRSGEPKNIAVGLAYELNELFVFLKLYSMLEDDCRRSLTKKSCN